MTYKYRLVFPNDKILDIRIRVPLEVGNTLTFGDKFRIIAMDQQLESQSFDRSITHEVLTIVQLDWIS